MCHYGDKCIRGEAQMKPSVRSGYNRSWYSGRRSVLEFCHGARERKQTVDHGCKNVGECAHAVGALAARSLRASLSKGAECSQHRRGLVSVSL